MPPVVGVGIFVRTHLRVASHVPWPRQSIPYNVIHSLGDGRGLLSQLVVGRLLLAWVVVGRWADSRW